jgi:hypothetical protein
VPSPPPGQPTHPARGPEKKRPQEALLLMRLPRARAASGGMPIGVRRRDESELCEGRAPRRGREANDDGRLQAFRSRAFANGKSGASFSLIDPRGSDVRFAARSAATEPTRNAAGVLVGVGEIV